LLVAARDAIAAASRRASIRARDARYRPDYVIVDYKTNGRPIRKPCHTRMWQLRTGDL
jgi:hypothetical protein